MKYEKCLFVYVVWCATALSPALQAPYFLKTYLSSVNALSQNVQFLDSVSYHLCGPLNIFSTAGGRCQAVSGPRGGWAALAWAGFMRHLVAKCPLPSLSELQLYECLWRRGWQPQVVPAGETAPVTMVLCGSFHLFFPLAQ